MLILFSFVMQAVSYEYQNKRGMYGALPYQWALFLNGILGPLLLGTAVGTFFTGLCLYCRVRSPFQPRWRANGIQVATLSRSNATRARSSLQSLNVVLGLAKFLGTYHRLLYFINNIIGQKSTMPLRKVAHTECHRFPFCILPRFRWLSYLCRRICGEPRDRRSLYGEVQIPQ